MTPLAYIKAALGAGLLALIFFGGRSCGVSSMETKLHTKDLVIAGKSQALRNAADSMNGFAAKFREIDANTQQQLAEAGKRAQAAEEFGHRAAAAEREAQKRAQSFEQQLAQAKRKPACKALLETSLEAVCNVTLE